MEKINILETTLRDGSYAVNFSFTSKDTALICKELEDAGFRFIEIGHGIGLNAANKGLGEAAASDEEYMKAASGVLHKAKFGMFCIPGIATSENVHTAADNGMGFIRIGTNADEVRKSKNFIKAAKRHGMFVTANFMKSYSLNPKKFAENVKISQGYGTDMIYIVDSAGGMFSEDIRKYYDAIRKITDIPVGFHGHDNLGLAVANSIAAIKMGSSFVDSSLQGLGRSSGNAPTELLIAALLKLKYEIKINFFKVLEIGQKYIYPIISTKGRMPLDIVSGYAQFHSSYMHYIRKFAAKHGVNPALLIIEWCKISKTDVDEKKMEAVAKRIKKDKEFYLGRYDFSRYVGNEQNGRKSKS